jgi:2-amino-4-hydroxy-6-hydroxymethyldihydropteridine diphosphokinase
MTTTSPGEFGLRTAFVALGSNLGDRIRNVRDAMEALSPLSPGRLLRSSLWETSPVDCPPGSLPFINAVVGFQPSPGETPESLLPKLQRVERGFGRKPKVLQNESRPLDVDLIVFGNEVRTTPELTLPHPRAHLRAFVLAPLAEISPDLRLPNQSHSVSELLASLPPGDVVRRVMQP